MMGATPGRRVVRRFGFKTADQASEIGIDPKHSLAKSKSLPDSGHLVVTCRVSDVQLKSWAESLAIAISIKALSSGATV